MLFCFCVVPVLASKPTSNDVRSLVSRVGDRNGRKLLSWEANRFMRNLNPNNLTNAEFPHASNVPAGTESPMAEDKKAGVGIADEAKLACKEIAEKSGGNEGIWCVLANVKRERPFGPGGAETKFGTPQFRGGTKVYIAGCYAGMCNNVVAIGLHRKSRRFITCVIDVHVFFQDISLINEHVGPPGGKPLVGDHVLGRHDLVDEGNRPFGVAEVLVVGRLNIIRRFE